MNPTTTKAAARCHGPNRRQAASALLGLLAALCATFQHARAADDEVVVSVYQGVCREGDFSANLATARSVVKEALDRGSHFVAIPECFLSGYASVEAVQSGARSLDDPELAGFIEESASHEMVVLAGLARKAKDGLYNSVLVIHRGRLLGIYDKVMLTGGDRDVLGFKAGTSVPVFAAHGVRFASIICHDSSFPHVAMAARLQGARLLFSPHNNEIASRAADDHRRSVRNTHVGLAGQLKMVVARANNVKSDREGQIGYGDSFILGPQGEPLAEAGLFKTGLITARIDRKSLSVGSVWADDGEVPAWLRTQIARGLTEFRTPTDDADLKGWLQNMVVHHRFTPQEVGAATGFTLQEVRDALRRLGLEGAAPPPRKPGDPLLVLPYPGGRHPRIGFLDGAVMPQRETKLSVFTPWDDASYVVVDVPEAVFSNLGLTYLAHTHIPTIWDARGIALPRLEWRRDEDGSYHGERALPNGVAFGADAAPSPAGVRMSLWLRNGTGERLTGLRVQNCVMLAGARGFADQSNANKVFRPPYAAARSEDGRRWVVTAWEPNQRCWGNPDCPCLHSDPQFPDCEPGATVRLRGWLSFYEGDDIDGELKRLDKAGWRD
ncbi:carbon-nitrogen hydrolase family protein [Paludisphaera soli]|uniref:carbon-nitrogen hydrolase family protein n=1 Tax=Paludisphaera soli TaxID=2712865 RepID=UPI0013EB2E98|nr:carbon-nitrogen hydrolase family protein [Paludisphaera soli]